MKIVYSDILKKIEQYDQFENSKLIEVKNSLCKDVFDSLQSKLQDIAKKAKIPFNIRIEETLNTNNAKVEKQGSDFSIQLSSEFITILFVYADMLSINLSKYLEFNKYIESESLRDAFFSYWLIILIYHEFAHAYQGHIEFLQSKGIIKSNQAYYLDFTENIDENSNLSKHQDTWIELENKADEYAISHAFLYVVKENSLSISKFREHYPLEKDNYFFDLKILGAVIATLFIFCDLKHNYSKECRKKKFFDDIGMCKKKGCFENKKAKRKYLKQKKSELKEDLDKISNNDKHPKALFRMEYSAVHINQEDRITSLQVIEALMTSFESMLKYLEIKPEKDYKRQVKNKLLKNVKYNKHFMNELKLFWKADPLI